MTGILKYRDPATGEYLPVPVGAGGGSEEVWVGPDSPFQEEDLWVDTNDAGAVYDWSTADARYLTSGFRNVIRNGDMQIAQRGTPISYTGDSYKYCLDGWLVWNETPGVGTTTVSQVAQADGPPLMQIVISGHTGTDKSSTLYQKIEDARTLNGREVTVSFVAKALTGAPKIYVGFGQYFGSGGSAGVSVPGQEVTISTVLQRYSVTLTLPSTAGKTFGTGSNLELYIGLSEGRSFGNQNNTFSLTDVQLEAGAAATAFERLPYQQQLAWCQRYFQRWQQPPIRGVMSSGTVASRMGMPLPVQMRATPSLVTGGNPLNVWDGSGTAQLTVLQRNDCTAHTLELEYTTSVTLAVGRPVMVYQNGAASGYCDLSAEL